jgi:hypothetical protein
LGLEDPLMANAIHKTSATDTLQLVARQYYDVLKPTGEADRVQQLLVVQAIRKATPTSITNLTAYADDAVLGAGKTLFVPTLRKVNRALQFPSSLPTEMITAFNDRGFRHARKLLRRRVDKVVSLMSSTYTDAQTRKAYVVTQFFNLDGMDPYTAAYLYETAGITTLAQLGAQSPASILAILRPS